jgi:NAD(P)-dependent dehydrogenase (short-subunit alcohol dehydrogenase family)
VQVTEGSARRAMPGRCLWAAGPFGVRALTQAAATELREHRIRVALLIVDAAIDGTGEGDDHSADPQSLADAVAYLAKPESTRDDVRASGDASVGQLDAVATEPR